MHQKKYIETFLEVKILIFHRSFYDVCDGIFLNYTWKEHNLERSLTACGSGSAYKVFVGVDVFGRNQYGGGGFKTQLVNIFIIVYY